MFLKKLEISGFKSFATKSVIDFSDEKTVTAIVGPNGSGKSNIADAVRWVLGEQSYKTIRSKKSEDVIFSGSNGKSKASAAKVSMLLDNSRGRAPIDFTEVEIERSVYRDGTSEYLINGKKSRLMDVAELLARSGFGQSTYSVIGQGMVDSMLFYGPAERKVLFDEAAGVRSYEIKREQTTRKLSDTAQNIIRIKDILSELNPRLSTLKRQAEKAQKKDEIAKTLAEKQKIYFASVWEKFNHQENEKRKELDKIYDEEEKVKKELNELNKKFEKILGQEKADNSKLDNLREKIENLEDKKDKLRQEIYTQKARLQVFGKGGLTQEEIKKKINILNNEINELKIAEKEKNQEQISKNLEIQDNIIAKITEEIEVKRKELSRLTAEVDSFDFGNLDKELNNILESQNLFLIKLESAEKIEEVKNTIKAGREITGAIEKLIVKIGGSKQNVLNEITQLQKEIEKLITKKEEVKSERDELKGELLEATYLLDAKKARRKEIKEENERLLGLKPINNKESQKISEDILKHEADIEKINQEIANLKEELNLNSNDFSMAGKNLTEIKDATSKKQILLSEYQQETTKLRIDIARIETKKQDLKEDIKTELGDESKLAGAKSIPEIDEELAKSEIEKLKSKLYAIGEIDPEVESEFQEVDQRVTYLTDQLSDLEKAKNDLEKLIKDLDEKIKKQFEVSFDSISKKFKHFFELLFEGGEAKLELVVEKTEDGEEKFGIEITAIPPGKRVKSLSALSGGERTLTSLALLFAILSVNPAPFVLLDEVDAALDETNTKRFLKIVHELSKTTQFIFISHNRETMKEADIIYGVTMDDSHASKLLSIRLEEAIKTSEK